MQIELMQARLAMPSAVRSEEQNDEIIIEGVALAEGVWHGKYYPREVLEKAVHLFKRSQIDIVHNEQSTGRVTDAFMRGPQLIVQAKLSNVSDKVRQMLADNTLSSLSSHLKFANDKETDIVREIMAVPFVSLCSKPRCSTCKLTSVQLSEIEQAITWENLTAVNVCNRVISFYDKTYRDSLVRPKPLRALYVKSWEAISFVAITNGNVTMYSGEMPDFAAEDLKLVSAATEMSWDGVGLVVANKDAVMLISREIAEKKYPELSPFIITDQEYTPREDVVDIAYLSEMDSIVLSKDQIIVTYADEITIGAIEMSEEKPEEKTPEVKEEQPVQETPEQTQPEGEIKPVVPEESSKPPGTELEELQTQVAQKQQEIDRLIAEQAELNTKINGLMEENVIISEEKAQLSEKYDELLNEAKLAEAKSIAVKKVENGVLEKSNIQSEVARLSEMDIDVLKEINAAIVATPKVGRNIEQAKLSASSAPVASMSDKEVLRMQLFGYSRDETGAKIE